MAEKSHPFYKYLFIFGKGEKKIVLDGKEISNYWNDIYDLFDLEEKMIVQKTNGGDFSEEEIRQIFWDLYEDMSDDGTLIKLWIPSLKKLEFWNFGDVLDIPAVKKITDSLDDEEFEKISDSIDNIRKGIGNLYLEQAFQEREKRELEFLTKGFKIKKVWELNKPENRILKQYLIFFKRAKEDSDAWSLNLRHIIDKNPNRKGELNRVYGLLCNSSIKGSTHEGEGVNLNKNLRTYTKDEIRFCERTIKIYLQSLINKAVLNKK